MNINKSHQGFRLTVKEIIICAVVLIITGFGFLGMHINSKDVSDKSEAREITASFESFDYSYARGGYIHYIVLEFSDAEDMTIDDTCASWELIDIIREIPVGTRIHMLIDESDNLILELRTEENILISYDDAVNNIRQDNSGFAVLGIVTIAGGLFLFAYFFRKNKETQSI